MSTPLSAVDGCRQLSARLAYGTISIRCVHQATEARIAATPIVDERSAGASAKEKLYGLRLIRAAPDGQGQLL